MASRIVLNNISYHGAGAVAEIGSELASRGYKGVRHAPRRGLRHDAAHRDGV